MRRSLYETKEADDAGDGAKDFRYEAGGKISSTHEPADRRGTAEVNGARAAYHLWYHAHLEVHSSRFLLTGDAHLRGLDFQRVSLELKAFDVEMPVIATPREIVRKFFR